jgi:multidrug resistance efflux pump
MRAVAGAAVGTASVGLKPTFEWIRLAQRVPVIACIEAPDKFKLRAGTTASVVVMTGTSRAGGPVPPVPLALQ